MKLPCRSARGGTSRGGNALRLDFNRPAAVLGPVLFCALARLAAMRSLAINALLLFGFIWIAIAVQGATLGSLRSNRRPFSQHARPRDYFFFGLSSLGVRNRTPRPP